MPFSPLQQAACIPSSLILSNTICPIRPPTMSREQTNPPENLPASQAEPSGMGGEDTTADLRAMLKDTLSEILQQKPDLLCHPRERGHETVPQTTPHPPAVVHASGYTTVVPPNPPWVRSLVVPLFFFPSLSLQPPFWELSPSVHL